MAKVTGIGALEIADFIRGALVAVGSAVVSFLQQFIFPTGDVPNFDFSKIQWKVVVGVAAAAFISYLAKNLFTNNKGVVLGIAATQPDNLRKK